MNKYLTNNAYEIRIMGHLDPHWGTWFEGWSVTNLENGEVLLKSTSVDQSALYGALNKIRDLNLILISINCGGSSTPDSKKG